MSFALPLNRVCQAVPAALILVALGVLTGCQGSQITFLDQRGRAPGKPAAGELFKAAALGDSRAVADLMSRGGDVNENMGTDTDQITPLMAAVVQGHSDVAGMLLKSGAKVRQNYLGYSAKDFAVFLENKSVTNMIDNRGSQ